MKILAVGCHPDDLEISCFGTLAKYASRGDKVSVCVVSNGNLGHEEISKEELGIIRIGEARAAAELIGADFYPLDTDDLHADAFDEDLIVKLTRVIRRTDPDLIITHGENDYHPDHIETYKAVFRASFAASVGHYDPEITEPPTGVPPIMIMDNLTGANFIPTHYVDISDFIDVKLKALSLHKSQVEWMLYHDHLDFMDMVKTCSKARGYQCGCAYAEGFRACVSYGRMTVKDLLP